MDLFVRLTFIDYFACVRRGGPIRGTVSHVKFRRTISLLGGYCSVVVGKKQYGDLRARSLTHAFFSSIKLLSILYVFPLYYYTYYGNQYMSYFLYWRYFQFLAQDK